MGMDINVKESASASGKRIVWASNELGGDDLVELMESLSLDADIIVFEPSSEPFEPTEGLATVSALTDALFAYLFFECEPRERTVAHLARLLSMAEPAEDGTRALDGVFEEIETGLSLDPETGEKEQRAVPHPDHPAVLRYGRFRAASVSEQAWAVERARMRFSISADSKPEGGAPWER